MSLKVVLLFFLTVWVVWKVKIVESGDSLSAAQNFDQRVFSDNLLLLDTSTIFNNFTSKEDIQQNVKDVSHQHSLVDFIPDVSIYKALNKRIKTPECYRDAATLLNRIQHLDFWALKMLDSSGKLTSGILNGNVNQFGDFDQCLSVDSNEDWNNVDNVDFVGDNAIDIGTITGKYCLAFLDVKILNHSNIDKLVHAYGNIVSNLTDPGHRVARMSTVSWGFCIPNTCSSEDLEQWLTDSWSNNTDVSIKVKVDGDMCYTKEIEPYSFAKKIALTVFFTLMAMTIVASFLNEDDNNNKTPSASNSPILQLVRSFSLRKNMTTLFNTSTPDDDIQCLHGMRGLSALCLIIFHKSAAIMFNPYSNKTAMIYSQGLAWSIIGRTAIIYTDTFILISGLLTSYIFIKDLDRKGKINIKDKYWTRFFRIAPNLIAVILFCTYILTDLGSGPQWNLVVKHHSDLCKSNMWRNLLFIHNYFGFENMCLTHTHQLGIDMQLFVLSPFIVWLLWRHLKTGLITIASLGVLSSLLRYYVALDKQLSPVLYFGATVTQMFDTANFSYILPTHRATVYVMGILMGYFLRRVKVVTLNKFQVTLMYIVGLSSGIYAMCGGYHMARRGYEYSAIEAAWWNAYAPIMWSTMLCLCIVVCTYGYGGFLNSILTWRGFVVFTRMAYGVYLTQFPVYFYFVGSQRIPAYYTPYMLFNLSEIFVIVLASIALTLLVDLPFQSIRKITWRQSRSNRNIKAVPKEDSKTVEKVIENKNEYILKQRKKNELTKRITQSSRNG